ncbi:hypothetical protein Hanom_Chr03g00239301 [Helianthus anomalus]
MRAFLSFHLIKDYCVKELIFRDYCVRIRNIFKIIYIYIKTNQKSAFSFSVYLLSYKFIINLAEDRDDSRRQTRFIQTRSAPPQIQEEI